MIGRRLGHYEIVEKLGEGGMGAVYRARDAKLGRDVALKLLPDFLAGDRERTARLEREAHLLASLNHPNVATLHGLEESDGLKYLVMELVPGETLAEKISGGPLRLEECLGILRQIAEGLEAAHEKGVIHRDLKPANVVVTSEGRIKVLDFGLAKAVAEEAPKADLSKSPTLTREGTEHGIILGTAPYMSPEQARGKTLDRRTDIWSFGCVFYEALTGRKAFAGETVSDTIAVILEKEPDWTALPARTPPKIRDLLRRCFQKEPHRRLRDIGDARIEIEEALAEPSAAPVTRPRRHHLPWVVAAVVSAVALWSLMRLRAEPERAVTRLTVTVPPEQALTWANDPSVALSPDGRRLVFVGGLGTERKLYVRPLDELVGIPIPGTEGATTAFFSPDGESVGFYSQQRKLMKVRLDTGLPVTLTDVPDAWGASWGPGDIILFSPTGSGLSRVSPSGGSPTVVTTPNAAQGETSHRWPEILPDGMSALFTILTATGSSRIALLSFDTGEYRVLLEGGSFARYVPTGHLVYVSEGALLAAPFDLERLELTGAPVPILEGLWTQPANGTAHFAYSAEGTFVYVPRVEPESTLVWVDRAGVVRPVTEIRRGFEDPRLSPDGERLSVAIQQSDQFHIWIYAMARDSFERLSFGPDQDQAAIWTPDGKRLTFRRGEISNLFWQPADGSGPEERLTTSPYVQRASSWSPDGKVLVYNERSPSEEAWDLWLFNLEDEPSQRPFLETPFREPFGAVSPDGRFLAYISNESGRLEIYVRPFPGPRGGKWKISTEGGVQPVWARSGREIFYRNGDKMMAAAIETEPEFRAGKPTLLFEGKFHRPEFAFPQYDVALDGQRFVMIQDVESAPTQIHIFQNWFSELKKRVPAGGNVGR
jgi:serine/threonine-protein kinase